MDFRGFSAVNRILLALLCVASFPVSVVLAEALPGFEDGADLAGNRVVYAGPAAADFDGDGRKEIVALSSNAVVTCLDSFGNQLWSYRMPNSNCSATGSTNRAAASPAIADLDGDRRLEVIVASGGITNKCNGEIVALDGLTGAVVSSFDLAKWLKKEKINENIKAFFATPALADLDGNGRMDILAPSFARMLLFFESGRKSKRTLKRPKMRFTTGDTAWSSPAIGQGDSDAPLEIAYFNDISRNDVIVPPTSNGGLKMFLDALPKRQFAQLRRSAARSTGKPAKKITPHIPFRSPTLARVADQLDQTPFSSPAIGPTVVGGARLMVAIGTGSYFPEGSRNKRGAWMDVFDFSNGELIHRFETAAASSSSPAIGDLNGDGLNDVVYLVGGEGSIGGPGAYTLYAFTPETGETLWTYEGANSADQRSSPVIADLNGDGRQEVVINRGGSALVFSSEGELLGSFNTPGAGANSPLVTDIDGDGKPELVINGGKSGGKVFVFTNLELDFPPLSEVRGEPYYAAWPMFKANPCRSGNRALCSD